VKKPGTIAGTNGRGAAMKRHKSRIAAAGAALAVAFSVTGGTALACGGPDMSGDLHGKTTHHSTHMKHHKHHAKRG